MKKSHLFSKQSGGTIGGLILGLIAGLAIAVIIALYITRSPTPFVEHTHPTTEPLNNHFATSTNSPNMPNALDIPNALNPSNSNAENAENMLSEPSRIVEIPPPSKEAVPEISANSAKTTFDGSYYLQIGAYRTQTDAEQQRAQLALQGLEAQVSRRSSGNLIYYRVRLGPFMRFEDMNSVRQQLASAGINAIVIRDDS